ncbi:hypothetical protein BC834DRAFT_840527 [Gloeopeniophorella convolvens]|nr:hypothetical protein BC834DRAFT_840527 [Gloeopeniophorella convolvens]
MTPAPAHHTKHLPLLHHPFLAHSFALIQRQDGTSTGTALWLGAQCLSLYLAAIHTSLARSSVHIRPRVLELGSGIGLAALAMRTLGWDVLATDTTHIISSVLSPNIASNRSRLPSGDGLIQIRELDWLVPPQSWDWSNPVAVASSSPLTSAAVATPIPGVTLQPPFDLIISADTLYASELVQPLLRTLHAAATTSSSSGSPPIYLCIERRDSAVIDLALSEAETTWGFAVSRIPHRRISKAIEKGGLTWSKEDWSGVEIWRLKLRKI